MFCVGKIASHGNLTRTPALTRTRRRAQRDTEWALQTSTRRCIISVIWQVGQREEEAISMLKSQALLLADRAWIHWRTVSGDRRCHWRHKVESTAGLDVICHLKQWPFLCRKCGFMGSIYSKESKKSVERRILERQKYSLSGLLLA